MQAWKAQGILIDHVATFWHEEEHKIVIDLRCHAELSTGQPSVKFPQYHGNP